VGSSPGFARRGRWSVALTHADVCFLFVEKAPLLSKTADSRPDFFEYAATGATGATGGGQRRLAREMADLLIDTDAPVLDTAELLLDAYL
jgi:hypothetical protein